jgi:hypothetical protein
MRLDEEQADFPAQPIPADCGLVIGTTLLEMRLLPLWLESDCTLRM